MSDAYVTLSLDEFLRRFLWHLLPDSFGLNNNWIEFEPLLQPLMVRVQVTNGAGTS